MFLHATAIIMDYYILKPADDIDVRKEKKKVRRKTEQKLE